MDAETRALFLKAGMAALRLIPTNYQAAAAPRSPASLPRPARAAKLDVLPVADQDRLARENTHDGTGKVFRPAWTGERYVRKISARREKRKS
jgi:hypothetical protein